jgi:glycerate dehydrogenase
MTNSSKPKAVVLNADRLNFDGRLTFEAIESVAELICYESTKSDQVAERAQGCHIVITKELQLHDDVINSLPPSVRLICEAGTGYDNIALEAARNKGITVCNVPGYSTSSVAQLTLTFVLMLSTGIHEILSRAALGDSADFHTGLRPLYSEVRGKSLGVIGAGSIGQAVISLARTFDMDVVVYNRSKRHWTDSRVVQHELAHVLAKSDFVSLHCPYQRGMPPLIQSETLAQMQPHACLINTARGQLVHHGDMVKALRAGVIAGAALDVQDPEPLPPQHEIWSLPNVILTPHIGWKAIESRRRLIEGVAQNIRAFLDNSPENTVYGT